MSDTNEDVILELKDVTKAYSGIVALKKANLKLRRGAVNVLVGENGAGKSTMMRIIAGVERPTLGEIWLDGELIHLNSPADAVKHGIGIVFQELNLFGNLSVAENILRPARSPAVSVASITAARSRKPMRSSTAWRQGSPPRRWRKICRSASSSSSRLREQYRSTRAS